jgi:hypothetical protein
MPTVGEYRVVEAATRRSRARVALRMCGVGAGRAAAMCAALERQDPPRAVALLGWAGGLVDRLGVGDIVLADQVLSAGRSNLACAGLELVGLPCVYYGPMLTSGSVLETPEAKRSAGKCGALAVEMEAYPMAAWAAEHGVAFVHGRVILDTVGEAVPELGGMLDSYGRVRVGALLNAVAGRPAWLREFARFAVRLRTVNRRLAALAEAVAAATEPDRWP